MRLCFAWYHPARGAVLWRFPAAISAGLVLASQVSRFGALASNTCQRRFGPDPVASIGPGAGILWAGLMGPPRLARATAHRCLFAAMRPCVHQKRSGPVSQRQAGGDVPACKCGGDRAAGEALAPWQDRRGGHVPACHVGRDRWRSELGRSSLQDLASARSGAAHVPAPDRRGPSRAAPDSGPVPRAPARRWLCPAMRSCGHPHGAELVSRHEAGGEELVRPGRRDRA